LNSELKRLRRELDDAQMRLREATAKRAKKKPTKDEDLPTGPRTQLPVPKGRYEDDPETLSEWLDVPTVLLVIDGYNVTKAEGGFGDLSLEKQRERLIDEAMKLARRKKVKGHIVFDGAEIEGGGHRRPRGPLSVEYSKAGEIADNHIVALVESLPPVPVVVVTNDRELQDRVTTLGATAATSQQLLALLR
jgi:predicted RNA-binding protein with PIN domain